MWLMPTNDQCTLLVSDHYGLKNFDFSILVMVIGERNYVYILSVRSLHWVREVNFNKFICLSFRRFDSSLELRKKFLFTDRRVCTTRCRRKLRFGSYRLVNTHSSAWRLNKNSYTNKIKAWKKLVQQYSCSGCQNLGT